jgi:hypothetical protein
MEGYSEIHHVVLTQTQLNLTCVVRKEVNPYMGEKSRETSFDKIPVYQRMNADSMYDFTMIAVIHELLLELHIRCGTKYRESRVETMLELVDKLEKSYPGYIPDAYKNRAEKFIKMMRIDLNETLKTIKKIKEV